MKMMRKQRSKLGDFLLIPLLAGATVGKGQTLFEKMHQERVAKWLEDTPWAPFASSEEWGLARWLVACGLSQSEIDKYLKLEIVSSL